MQFFEVDPAEAWGLDPTQTLLPEVLQDAGYGTYMIGKWNLGTFPKRIRNHTYK
jgi:arylsulfatase A-like enzyme